MIRVKNLSVCIWNFFYMCHPRPLFRLITSFQTNISHDGLKAGLHSPLLSNDHACSPASFVRFVQHFQCHNLDKMNDWLLLQTWTLPSESLQFPTSASRIGAGAGAARTGQLLCRPAGVRSRGRASEPVGSVPCRAVLCGEAVGLKARCRVWSQSFARMISDSKPSWNEVVLTH